MHSTASYTICQPSKGKKIITVVMIQLLLLLTSINYFIYTGNENSGFEKYGFSADGNNTRNDLNTPTNNNPSGPDEKTPDAPASFTEEYVHEVSGYSHPVFNATSIQHPEYSESLLLAHYQLFTPPPDC